MYEILSPLLSRVDCYSMHCSLPSELFNTETIEPGAEEAPRGMHRNNVAPFQELRLVTVGLFQAPPWMLRIKC